MEQDVGGSPSKRELYKKLLAADHAKESKENLGHSKMASVVDWTREEALQNAQLLNQDLKQDIGLKRIWSTSLGKWAGALITFQIILVTVTIPLSFFVPETHLEVFKWIIGVAIGGSFAQLVTLIGIVLKGLFQQRK